MNIVIHPELLEYFYSKSKMIKREIAFHIDKKGQYVGESEVIGDTGGVTDPGGDVDITTKIFAHTHPADGIKLRKGRCGGPSGVDLAAAMQMSMDLKDTEGFSDIFELVVAPDGYYLYKFKRDTYGQLMMDVEENWWGDNIEGFFQDLYKFKRDTYDQLIDAEEIGASDNIEGFFQEIHFDDCQRDNDREKYLFNIRKYFTIKYYPRNSVIYYPIAYETWKRGSLTLENALVNTFYPFLQAPSVQ